MINPTVFEDITVSNLRVGDWLIIVRNSVALPATFLGCAKVLVGKKAHSRNNAIFWAGFHVNPGNKKDRKIVFVKTIIGKIRAKLLWKQSLMAAGGVNPPTPPAWKRRGIGFTRF